MFRLLSVAAAILTIASAFGLYSIKYDTRALEAELQAGERAIEKIEGDIAVLKAEKAYLARPERIEKLARKQGLGAIRQEQYVELGAASPPVASAQPDQAKTVCQVSAAAVESLRPYLAAAMGGAGDAGARLCPLRFGRNCCLWPSPASSCACRSVSETGIRIAMAEPIGRVFSRPDIVDRRGRLIATDVGMPSLYVDPAAGPGSRRGGGEAHRTFCRPGCGGSAAAARRPQPPLCLDAARTDAAAGAARSRSGIARAGVPPRAQARLSRRAPWSVTSSGRSTSTTRALWRARAPHRRQPCGIESVLAATQSRIGRSACRSISACSMALALELKRGADPLQGERRVRPRHGCDHRRVGGGGVAARGRSQQAGGSAGRRSARPAQRRRVRAGLDLQDADRSHGARRGRPRSTRSTTCAQPMQFGAHTINDLHPQGRPLSVRDVFIHSSNVGAGMMALEAGSARQIGFLSRLGLLAGVAHGSRARGGADGAEALGRDRDRHHRLWPRPGGGADAFRGCGGRRSSTAARR